MQNKYIFFLAQYIFFYIQYELAEALVGENVREATEGQFANVVCIVRQSNAPRNLRYDVRCTGTLITNDHILTSEHCFNNIGYQGLRVLIESIDLRLAKRYYIAWWITYNQWATVVQRPIIYEVNDIAIIKLIQKVPQTILPAVLSPVQNTNLFGLDVTLAGWGQMADGNHPYILNIVQTRIISNQDCELLAYRLLQRRVPIHERYVCSIAEPWALLNSGDSGGPIFFGTLLLGINQGTCPRTESMINPQKANLHCTVDYYREFITYNMEI